MALRDGHVTAAYGVLHDDAALLGGEAALLDDAALLGSEVADSERATTGDSRWRNWILSSSKPVVVAIGLTALVMWVFTHMSTMTTPTVVTMATGSPIVVSSGGSSSLDPQVSPSPSTVVQTIIVQVLGQVREPGLVTLPLGARVSDAIEAAGGLRSMTSSGGLNLARHVVDGEQILVSPAVPTTMPGAGSAGSSSPTGSVSVDLNSADLAALDALPGVGPVMAARILSWRDQHGRFTTIDQLREISGIGQRTFERLRALVHV